MMAPAINSYGARESTSDCQSVVWTQNILGPAPQGRFNVVSYTSPADVTREIPDEALDCSRHKPSDHNAECFFCPVSPHSDTQPRPDCSEQPALTLPKHMFVGKERLPFSDEHSQSFLFLRRFPKARAMKFISNEAKDFRNSYCHAITRPVFWDSQSG